MNRHARRAQAAAFGTPKPGGAPPDLSKALTTLGSLQDFATVVERLKPFLSTVEQLSVRLELASDALAQAQRENAELRKELTLQRQLFLRLCAKGMGITVGQVLSMETVILEQLASENGTHADPTPEPEPAVPEASHSGT